MLNGNQYLYTMFDQNNKKNSRIDLSEPLQAIRESIISIRRTIEFMNSRKQKNDKEDQPMFEDIHNLLSSLSHVLKHSIHHAKNKDEILQVKQTHDLVNEACSELKQIL